MGKRAYLIHEVAELIGLHPQTIRKYADTGLIKAHRDINGFRRIPIEEIKKLELIVEGLYTPEKE